MGSYIFYSLYYFFHLPVSIAGSKTKESQNRSVLPLGSPQYYFCFSTELLEMFDILIAFKLKNECTLTCSFSCSCIDTLQNRIRCFDLSLSYTVVCFVVSLYLTLNFHYTTDLFPNNWASKSSNVQHSSGVLNCVHSRCCKLSILTVIILHKIQRNKLSVAFPCNAMKISLW